MVRQPMAETWDAKERRQRLERRRPRVAARLAAGRSPGLLEPAEGLAGGAPRAGARAPTACTTARDTAGKRIPDCRCSPCITAGNGAPSAPRARWARDPALCVDVGRVAADRSSHGAVRDRRRPRCRLAWRSRTTPRVILRRVAPARDSLHHPNPPNRRGPPATRAYTASPTSSFTDWTTPHAGLSTPSTGIGVDRRCSLPDEVTVRSGATAPDARCVGGAMITYAGGTRADPSTHGTRYFTTP